jgi:saccharopine dehydrogenase (NAD+, L-lysine-forming)
MDSGQRPTEIVVLGGYGTTGLKVARLLAADPAFRITLVGRNPGRLALAAAEIRADSGTMVATRQGDAGDALALATLIGGADLVLSATSDTRNAPQVARAALTANCDYMDIHLSSAAKWAMLRVLEPDIARSQRLFISDGGIHPGLPAVLIRDAASVVELDRAEVYGAFAVDWANLSLGSNAPEDFVAELKQMDPSVWQKGAWRRSWRNMRAHDFGPPFGRQSCVAMALEEMRALPKAMPKLTETGFYVAGFGPLIDKVVLPLVVAGLAIPGTTRAMGRLLLWSLKRFASGMARTFVDLDGRGTQDGRPVSVRSRVVFSDAYDLTALATVACLEQYRAAFVAGSKPVGLMTQAAFVEPGPFLAALGGRGVRYSREVLPVVA